MLRVIFPQAVRSTLPSIGNELVNNVKGTSVLNIIGFVELMFATGSVAGEKVKVKISCKNPAKSYNFTGFGGGGWIRTTEVTDNRFTVCPLWPLGNSSI